MRYIVHLGTGTVISANECTVVELTDEDLSLLDGDDYFDDTLVEDLARMKGYPLSDFLPDEGYVFQ